MTDQLKICNSALIKIGVNRITALTETNKAAILCNEQYDKMRRACLREHPWNFAIRRVELATLSATPAFEYLYAFLLPTDVIRVLPPSSVEVATCKYKIEGRDILTNESTLKIKYIADVTDASQFDDSFAEALATRLAADLAYSLVQSNTLATQMLAYYEKVLSLARTADAQEGTPDELMEDVFINARFY